MGNSVSCFDPVREHPPYSWPKDHPERAAAIAEKKRQRRNQKIVGTGGGAHTVSREPAKPVSPATPEEKKPLVDAAKEEEKAAEVKDAVSTEKEVVVDEVKEVKDDVQEDEKEVEVVESAAVAVAVDDEKKEEGKDDVKEEAEGDKMHEEKDGVADDTDVVVPVVAEKGATAGEDEEIDPEAEAAEAVVAVGEVVDEEVQATDDIEQADSKEVDAIVTPLPSEEKEEEIKVVEEEKAEAEPTSEVVAPVVVPGEEPTAEPEPEPEEKPDLKSEPEPEPEPEAEPVEEVPAFDARRAMFEQPADDELPEAKEVTRDVLDPVTNEYISISEYRQRQSDRARGVVKERVEKYEEVDDRTAKERAEFAAIEAHRTEAIEKAEWTFKHGSKKTLESSTSDKVLEEEVEPAIPVPDIKDEVSTPVANRDTADAVTPPPAKESLESKVEQIGEIGGVQEKVEKIKEAIGAEEAEEAEDESLPSAAAPIPMA